MGVSIGDIRVGDVRFTKLRYSGGKGRRLQLELGMEAGQWWQFQNRGLHRKDYLCHLLLVRGLGCKSVNLPRGSVSASWLDKSGSTITSCSTILLHSEQW